jgi:hypothetical protein
MNKTFQHDKIFDARPKQPYVAKTDILELIRTAKGITRLERYPCNNDVALDLLSLNFQNRPAKLLDIDKVKSDYKNEKYIYTGIPIIVSARENDVKYVDIQIVRDRKKDIVQEIQKKINSHVLLDGQKRLMALVGTDLTIEMDIIINIPFAAKWVIDNNRVRSLADTVRMLGFKNHNSLMAAIRGIYYIQNFKRVGKNIKGADVMDNDAMQQWVNQDKEVNLVVRLLAMAEHWRLPSTFGLKFMTPSEVATMYYLFYKINQDKADYFFEKLASGASLNTVKNLIDNNINKLRNKLNNLAQTIDGRRGISRAEERFKYVIVTWNACMEGVRLEKIAIDPKSQELPRITRKSAII